MSPVRPVLLALAAVAALPAGAQAASCADADLSISAATATRAEAAVVCLVNRERTTRGLDALRGDERLAAAAQGHTDEMLALRYFDHVSPTAALATPALRATAAGYVWNVIGENIASGQSTPREVMLGWMASTGHCRNILGPDYQDIGVGAAPGFARGGDHGGTWTQMFGRLRTSSAGGSDAAQAGCPYRTLAPEDGTPAGPATPGTSTPQVPGTPSTPVPGTQTPGTPTPGTTAPAVLRATAVRRGTLVVVRGTLTGAAAGSSVVVRITRTGHRRIVRTVRTTSRGTFAVAVRAARSGGTLTVTVVAAGATVTLRLP